MTEGTAQKMLREAREKAKASYQRVKGKLEAANATTRQVVLETLGAAEIGAVAFGFGFMRGYYGEKNLLNVPVELWATFAFHGVGLVLDFRAKPEAAGDWDRMVARQLHNLGNGALAAYTHTLGASMGAEMRAKQPAPPNQAMGPATAGALPGPPQYAPQYAPQSYLPQGRAHEPYNPEPITHAEMMQMAT